MLMSTRRRPSLDALESRRFPSTVGLSLPPVSISAMYATNAGPSPIDPTLDPIGSPTPDAPPVAAYDVVYLNVMPGDDTLIVDPFSSLSLD